MITIEQLKEVAKLKGIRNLGYAEKDYLIDLILLSISRNTKNELVFKGGTCLYKFYKIDRFSEDIDFTLRKELDIDKLLEKIISDLKSFGIEAEIKLKKKFFNSVMTTIRTKGPMYTGTPQTFSNIRIDINLKSSVDTEPEVAKYSSLYPDIPAFSLVIMQKKEILSEKIRTILTREKARDAYDLWFLLEKGVEFDEKLVKEKLKYYNEEWDITKFKKKLDLKRKLWDVELKPLINNVPDFGKVKKTILEKVVG